MAAVVADRKGSEMSTHEPSSDPVVEELQRQVERASLFTHTALGEGFARTAEGQAFLYGLADVLLAKGYVSEEELGAAVVNARSELTRRGELSGPGTMVRIDEEESTGEQTVEVDCSARMHICKAVCCRLDFALTVSEVESGNVKWDLGRPYFVRHNANGCCVHNDPQTGGCGIYADRPRVCRRYSCANDGRIWKNFEQMELNTEWIDEHLQTQENPRAIGVYMHETVPSSSLREL
jgi:Fe-S-cluster containining protein